MGVEREMAELAWAHAYRAKTLHEGSSYNGAQLAEALDLAKTNALVAIALAMTSGEAEKPAPDQNRWQVEANPRFRGERRLVWTGTAYSAQDAFRAAREALHDFDATFSEAAAWCLGTPTKPWVREADLPVAEDR